MARKKKDKKCVACKGTGRSSKGGICSPCKGVGRLELRAAGFYVSERQL